MEPNRFYDIHFHEMDLSHANLTAFLNRFLNERNGLLNEDFVCSMLSQNLPKWKFFFLPFVSYAKLASKTIDLIKGRVLTKKVRNLLSYMESSILYDFLIVEYFLKKGDPEIVTSDNLIKDSAKNYNRIVLCPLIMDFGYKNLDLKEIFYNIPPQKPVTEQVKDMFDAIYTYYNNEISIRTENHRIKFSITPIIPDPDKKLFEIYPFMGINTKNYTYEEVRTMLEKYFCDFSKNDSPEVRKQKLREKMGVQIKDLDDKEACKNRFAGIKVYPPLGFEPWPDNREELKKVNYMYDLCIEKNIPLVTHCSTDGFLADVENVKYADPGLQWQEVIRNKPGIKINFAHFGDGSELWKEKIIEHILSSGSRVFTDISCNTEHDAYYKKLHSTIHRSKDQNLLASRILFGSDFMINLIWLKSYNQYLDEFLKTKYLTVEQKHLFVQQNPEEFLFG